MMASPSNRSKRMAEAAEGLWVVLQQVDEGDWGQQSETWQMAAEHARDYYFGVLKELMDDAGRAAAKG